MIDRVCEHFLFHSPRTWVPIPVLPKVAEMVEVTEESFLASLFCLSTLDELGCLSTLNACGKNNGISWDTERDTEKHKETHRATERERERQKVCYVLLFHFLFCCSLLLVFFAFVLSRLSFSCVFFAFLLFCFFGQGRRVREGNSNPDGSPLSFELCVQNSKHQNKHQNEHSKEH